MRQLLVQGCAIIALMVSCSLAFGQFEERARISRYTSRGLRSTTQSILSRPTVSPYLALTDLTGSGQVDTSRNYFTQVRPQLENRQQALQQRQSLINVQREVSAIRAAGAQRSQTPKRATGHPTRRNFLMNHYNERVLWQFYPGLARR